MRFDSYQVFRAMYYVLDAAYGDIKNEELLQFLSDANPFVWKGRVSADPAIYIEFKEAFDKKFGEMADEQKSLEFVREYLKNENSPILMEAFNSIITPGNWTAGLTA